MIVSRTSLARSLLVFALGGLAACAESPEEESPEWREPDPDAGLDARVATPDGATHDGAPGDADPDAAVEGDAQSEPNDDAGASDYDPRDPVVVIPARPIGDFPLENVPTNAAGDLLISETGRGCLAVAGGAAPAAGAGLTIATCRGTEGQLWLVDGAVRLAKQPELCLDADAKLKLSRCSGLNKTFALGSDGVILRDNTAVDLTGAGEVVPYGVHRNENQRWTLLRKDLDFLETNRSRVVSYPLLANDTLGFEIEQARHRVGSVQPPYPLKATRDVSKFPGEVDAAAPTISRRVHVDRRFDHDTGYLRVSWPPQNWQGTGIYAPAGKTLIVTLPDDAKPGLFVRLNTHTDALSPDSSNVRGGSFKRMPRVSLRIALTPGVNPIRTPYGGDLVLESSSDTGDVVPVEIHGGVEMPRFVLGVTSAAEWQRRRALGAPWAELEGKRTAILVPSSEVRALERPEEVMARYDRTADLQAALSGLDANTSSGVHRLFDGKARFVDDTQITAGSGHSGFPIMAMDWDLANQRTGGNSWGVWHELGHNHQQFCLWATRFGTETTVNIYSLYVQQALQPGENRIADQFGTVIAGLENGSMSFASADVWQKLVFLVQPVYAFPERGFDLYAAVHRAYRELPDSERSSVCGSEALQVDTFYRFLSRAVGHDLADHFTRWGLTLSASARKAVADEGLRAPSQVVWRARP